jgi:riboflavin transporter FmnP
MNSQGKEAWPVKTVVKISVLGVISFSLMFLKTPLWFTPPFLKFDISDLPSVIGAFAMGPGTGVWIQLIKNTLNVLVEGTVTNGVGEFSNFLVGSVLAYVSGFVYHRRKAFKNALLGLGLGVLAMVTFATLSNYYVMFPLFAKVFGWELDKIVSMGSKVNKYVVDYKSLMLYAVIPFNLLKGAAVSLAAVLVYKRISPLLHR